MSGIPATGKEVQARVLASLDRAYEIAGAAFAAEGELDFALSDVYRDALKAMSDASSTASSGFTNLVTGLAIKAAIPEIDVRYHQVQIQDPKLFNFRGVSEKAVYPWLASKDFEGAKSGWQTRTFERPKPYMLDYDENIGAIKQPFLTCYDEISTKGSDALSGLAYLLYEQMLLREKKQVPIAVPKIDQIEVIVGYFQEHFNRGYTAKGASRLPVLAMYAIYQAMMGEVARYNGANLKPLESHSAADAQTGSVGDIEIENAEGNLFEGLEIKHGIKISAEMVEDFARKIMEYSLDRYYVLTTHQDCKPDTEILEQLKTIRERIGCQIIVNGVIPTIQYYLRLLNDPSSVFPYYSELLKADTAISHEHRVSWNEIVIG